MEYFVQKGADKWNKGLAVAKLKNHPHLVKFFRSKLISTKKKKK
jgi:hypothetical protein